MFRKNGRDATLPHLVERARSGEYYLSPDEAQRLAFYIDNLDTALRTRGFNDLGFSFLRERADKEAMAASPNARRAVRA